MFIMEKVFTPYLEKQALYPPLIGQEPHVGLKTIVCIPVYNEPGVLDTLKSLIQCRKPRLGVEVLLLINDSGLSGPEVKEQNKQTFSEITRWVSVNSTREITFHCLYKPDLPAKHAGVGLARKILMDEAIRRFKKVKEPLGVIISLDADTTVSINYLSEIEAYFQHFPKSNVVTFHFEHPINTGNLENLETKAIVLYELYLRYFKLALQATGFPYPFYTIGSCFAVSAQAYIKQGGMNRRKAGEDFYFLHKIFPLGGYAALKNISVYPSSRKSDRVPFGTGAAVKKIVTDGFYTTYHPIYFKHLEEFFSFVPKFYGANNQEIKACYKQLPESIQTFISGEEFENQIHHIKQNSASEKTFAHRFYQWFDAFKVIKFLNFTHQQAPKIPITQACLLLAEWLFPDQTKLEEPYPLLQFFRDREQTF